MNPGNSSGMNGMQQQQHHVESSNSNIMGGDRGATVDQAPSNGSAEADDFGAFEEANRKNSNTSSDPLSKLISLDGLSKNKKESTEEDERTKSSKISTAIAFAGVDGLNKVPTDFAVKNTTNHRLSDQSVMMSNVQANNGVAGNQGQMGMMGNSQQGMMGNSQQGMMGNSQQGMMSSSQQGMMGNSQQGMMGNVQQGMMGNVQQGMMGNSQPGMMGNAQQGMMGNPQQGMMSNSQ